jgi:hypothetical protein
MTDSDVPVSYFDQVAVGNRRIPYVGRGKLAAEGRQHDHFRMAETGRLHDGGDLGCSPGHIRLNSGASGLLRRVLAKAQLKATALTLPRRSHLSDLRLLAS